MTVKKLKGASKGTSKGTKSASTRTKSKKKSKVSKQSLSRNSESVIDESDKTPSLIYHQGHLQSIDSHYFIKTKAKDEYLPLLSDGEHKDLMFKHIPSQKQWKIKSFNEIANNKESENSLNRYESTEKDWEIPRVLKYITSGVKEKDVVVDPALRNPIVAISVHSRKRLNRRGKTGKTASSKKRSKKSSKKGKKSSKKRSKKSSRSKRSKKETAKSRKKSIKSFQNRSSRSSKYSRSDSQTKGLKLRNDDVEKPIIPTYQLSNPKYLREGWTKLRQPNFKITEKLFTFRTTLSHPLMNAFQTRNGIFTSYYDNNQLAALFQEENGSYIYYPNGEVAISITEGRVGPKMVVYSMTKIDEFGVFMPSHPMAVFDSDGNGVVYSYDGEIRLNYDQAEGALYDTKSRQPVHWMWKISEYLKQRRADLDGVVPDSNDDIDFSTDRRSQSSRKIGTQRLLTPKKKVAKRKKRKSPKSRTYSGSSKTLGSGSTKRSKKKKRKPKTRKKTKKGKTKSRKAKSKKSKKSRKSKKSKSSKTTKSKSSRKKRSRRRTKKSRTRRKLTPKSTRITVKIAENKKPKTYKKGNKYVGRYLPPLRDPPIKPAAIVEIKPIAMRITDHVSIRIMDQTHIHVDFFYYPKHFRLHVGVLVHPEFLERIDKVVDPQPVNNIVPCYFELMHKRSQSIYNLYLNLLQMRRQAFKKRKINTLKKCRLMGYKYDMIRRRRPTKGVSF